MTLQEIILHRLKLPLLKPYRVSFKIYTEFEPILIETRGDDGGIGWGEAHIPTGSSFETADSGWKFCCEYAAMLQGKSVAYAKKKLDRAVNLAPNAASAMLMSIAMLERHPVLQPKNEVRIPLLTAVSATTEPQIKEEVRQHIANGYRTLKVKVGWNVNDDLERVEVVRKAASGCADVTLDANRAFSRNDGCRFAQSLNPEGIKLLEQPCAADDWISNAEVAHVSRVPLMLDESITSVAAIERASTIDGVKFVKMKLKRMGGIERLLIATRRAQELGLTVCLGDGVATEVGCWFEACVANEAVDSSGEMNGFLKTKERLFVEPLAYESAAIVLKPGFWPEIDRKVLSTHRISKERFAGVQVA